jgi:Flp pilus assembly CpaF family ATPase
MELPYHATKSNIADSVDLIVQIERRPGRRFVSEVLEIQGNNPGADRYSLTPVFTRKEE